MFHTLIRVMIEVFIVLILATIIVPGVMNSSTIGWLIGFTILLGLAGFYAGRIFRKVRRLLDNL